RPPPHRPCPRLRAYRPQSLDPDPYRVRAKRRHRHCRRSEDAPQRPPLPPHISYPPGYLIPSGVSEAQYCTPLLSGGTMLLERIYDEDLSQASYFIGCQSQSVALVVDPRRDIQVYLDLAAHHG